MDAVEKIQELENKRAKLVQAIAKAKQSLHAGEKKAETHVKAAMGGAVMAMLETLPVTVRHAILAAADQGVQKQGLGREKFDALKTKFKKTEEK